MLRDIAGFIAKDEFRHTQFAFDLLQARVNERADYRDRILEEGLSFRHVGADVVTDVPISEKNDLGAILTLNRKMRRLCGASLSDFAKGGISMPVTERELWLLNFYRNSELHGALLMGRLARTLSESSLLLHATKHCATEAHHAALLLEAIVRRRRHAQPEHHPVQDAIYGEH